MSCLLAVVHRDAVLVCGDRCAPSTPPSHERTAQADPRCAGLRDARIEDGSALDRVGTIDRRSTT
ncbi:hypothetical protein EIP91_011001, partial [Steccherinum ochraceum]